MRKIKVSLKEEGQTLKIQEHKKEEPLKRDRQRKKEKKGGGGGAEKRGKKDLTKGGEKGREGGV